LRGWAKPIGKPGRLRRGDQGARLNNEHIVVPRRPRLNTANGRSLPSPNGGFARGGAGAKRRCARGVEPGPSSEKGRRPLLGPPARFARVLSQRIGDPSMHTPGHTRALSGKTGKRKPGRPGRGMIRAAGLRRSIPTRPSSGQTRKGRAIGSDRCWYGARPGQREDTGRARGGMDAFAMSGTPYGTGPGQRIGPTEHL
jgi:hypothetical protein